MLLLLLCACTEKTTTSSDAVIKRAELTPFEDNLPKLIDNRSFAYDIDVKTDQVSKIIGTVDYYENGEFVRQISEISTKIMEEEQQEAIRMVFMREPKSDDQEQWIASIMRGGSQSSVSTKNDINDIEKRKKMALGSGTISEVPLSIGKKKVVATMVYTDEKGMTIINNIETEEELKMATDYEHVYVISVEMN